MGIHRGSNVFDGHLKPKSFDTVDERNGTNKQQRATRNKHQATTSSNNDDGDSINNKQQQATRNKKKKQQAATTIPTTNNKQQQKKQQNNKQQQQQQQQAARNKEQATVTARTSFLDHMWRDTYLRVIPRILMDSDEESHELLEALGCFCGATEMIGSS